MAEEKKSDGARPLVATAAAGPQPGMVRIEVPERLGITALAAGGMQFPVAGGGSAAGGWAEVPEALAASVRAHLKSLVEAAEAAAEKTAAAGRAALARAEMPEWAKELEKRVLGR